MEMAEPNLGDIGIIEEAEVIESAQVDEVDDEMLQKINVEKATLNVRDSQLLQIIEGTKVHLTETEMRQAESDYVTIDENVQQSASDVAGSSSDNAAGPDEEEKKGEEEESKSERQSVVEDQPTLLAKKLLKGGRTQSTIQQLGQSSPSP